MNKKLLEMLDKINTQKAKVRDLVSAGDLEAAKAEKEKLKNMQLAFDLSKDLYDSEPQNIAPTATPIKVVDAVKAFAAAARQGFKNLVQEGTDANGGYTVPKDIQTKINEHREASFSLQDLVTVTQVATASGARTYKKKTQLTGFTLVGEGAAIPAAQEPTFEQITYAIKKYAGWIPVTNEVLADNDANLTSFLVNWLADESRVTRNKLILEALTTGKESTYTTIADIDDITRALNVTLGQAYKPYSKIVTNDYGLQELSELKDANGRPMLQPMPNEPMKLQLAAGAVIVPVEVVPASDMPNVTDSEKTYAPIIIGDLQSAVTLFDRNQVTIKTSDTAAVTGYNAFENDLTIFRGIEREDVKIADTDAYILGHFSTEIA